MSSQIPAVVLGSSSFGGATVLGVIRSLGREGVPVRYLCSDPNSLAVYSRYVRSAEIPHITREPDRYLDTLLAHGGDERPVLFGVGDTEQQFLANHHDQLKERFRLPTASSATVTVLLDKRNQWKFAEQAGLTIPRTATLESTEAIESIADTFKFPVFAKPRLSHQRRTIEKGELFLTREQWLVRAPELLRGDQSQLVQEVVAGPASAIYQVPVYRNAQGRLLAAMVTHKIRDYPRQFGIATLIETVRMPELVELSEKFLAASGYTGVGNVEFKFDSETGQYVFLELNMRYWFSTALSTRAGINFPWLEYQDLTGIQPAPQSEYRTGTRWPSLSLDLKSAREAMRAGECGFWGWLWSYRGVREEAFLAPDDWMPFIHYVADLIRLPLPRAKYFNVPSASSRHLSIAK